LGFTAPVAGLIASQYGYNVIYCFGALAAVISAILAFSLRRPPVSAHAVKLTT
jgi:hypothetical protein